MKMSTAEVEFLNVRKGYLKSNLSVEVSVNKVGPADRVVLNRYDADGKVSQVVSKWVDQPAGEPAAQRRLCVSFDPSKLMVVKASSPSHPILFFFAYENVTEDVCVVGESERFYLCEKEADIASLCPTSSRPGSERSSFDVLSFPEGNCSGIWPSNAGDRLSSPLSGWSEAEIVSYLLPSQINTGVLSGESFEEVSGGSLDVMEIGPDDIQRVTEADKSASIAGLGDAQTAGCDSEEDEILPIFAEDEDTVVPMPTGAPASVAYEFVSLPQDPDPAPDEQPLVKEEDVATEKEDKLVELFPEEGSRAGSKSSTERIRHRSNSADSLPRLSVQEKDVPVPALERSLSDSYNLVSHSVLAAEDQVVMLLKRQLKEAHKQSGLLERKLEEVTESKRQLEVKVSRKNEELAETKEELKSTTAELENLQMALCASESHRDGLLVVVAELTSKLASAEEMVKSLERELRLKTNEKLQAYKEARLFAQELNQVKRAPSQELPKPRERRPQSAKPSRGVVGGRPGEEAGSVGVSLATGSAYKRRRSTASCGSCDEEEVPKSDRVRRQTSHQSSSADDLSGLHEVSSILEAQLFVTDKQTGDALNGDEEDISDEDLSKLAMSLQGPQSVCPYCKKFLCGFETELLRNLHYEDCSKYQRTATVLEENN